VNTCEALEAIADPGRFENLVTDVLRSDNPLYRYVIRIGVNAQGRTIKSPLDGFCLVPGSEPPHFIMVQHTTTGLKHLRGKWLNDPEPKEASGTQTSEPGDLVKAIAEAEECRRDFPRAVFTVVLATNQRVKDQLLKDVYKVAEAGKVNLDPYEQSRLAGFLDNEPDGQWLRQQYLEISAVRLSRDLLHSLCCESLHLYKDCLLSPPQKAWIEREAEDGCWEATSTRTDRNVFFLRGLSGSGKSVIAYRILERQIESGGLGLWLDAGSVLGCVSLENALNKTLSALHPDIEQTAGQRIQPLLARQEHMLLVVDDVSRTDNPFTAIHKLISWAKPKEAGTSLPKGQRGSSKVSGFQIICPVWSQMLDAALSRTTDHSFIEQLEVPHYQSEEGIEAVLAVAALHGADMTRIEAGQLAAALQNDPFLIGRLSGGIDSANMSAIPELASQVLREYIDGQLQRAEQESQGGFVAADFRTTLMHVSRSMLDNKTLLPSWKQIENWLGSEVVHRSAVRELAQRRRIFDVRPSNGTDRLFYRHDRLRDYCLVECLSEMLCEGNCPIDLLEDPYFASLLAASILRSERDREFLEMLRDRNPLILFEAIRLFGDPTSGYQRSILDLAKEWWKTHVLTKKAPKVLLHAILVSLANTDARAVVDITDRIPLGFDLPYPYVIARLRNGCVLSGAGECLGNHGYISTKNTFACEILDHAAKRHEERMIGELTEILASSESIYIYLNREGAMKLASILRRPELTSAVQGCWELSQKQLAHSHEAITATIRCTGGQDYSCLDPMIREWVEDPKLALKMASGFAVGDLLHNEWSTPLVDYFIRQARRHKCLVLPICHMFDGCSLPEALEFTVRQAAVFTELSAIEQRTFDEKDANCEWAHRLWSVWFSDRSLPPESAERLKQLWSDEDDEPNLRAWAFHIWCSAAEHADLDELGSVSEGSPLRRKAVKTRMRLCDNSVVPDLLSMLDDDPNLLWGASSIWCRELKDAVNRQLRQLEACIPTDYSGCSTDLDFTLAELLTEVPQEDAEELLSGNWEHLRYCARFVMVALCVGTQKMFRLADEAIQACPKGVDLFKDVDWIFGFHTMGRKERLDRERVSILLAYLNRMSKTSVWYFAQFCEHNGLPDMIDNHLLPFLSAKHQRGFRPTDEDLIDILKVHKPLPGYISWWMESFEKRDEPTRDAVRVLDRFLSENPDLQSFRKAALFLEMYGTRDDLALLDKHPNEGPDDWVSQIKENTRFAVRWRTLA